MMDQLASIRAFNRVVEAGGFAAAAREMGLSRSVVNKAVINLEQQLGTQLLRRSTRQVTATATGLALYERTRPLITELDATLATVQELQQQPVGNLRVNAPMTFGTRHLAGVIAEYMAQYPDVHVELVLNDRVVDPLEEGFDLTIRIKQEQHSTSLIQQVITPIKLLLCASSGYLAKAGEPQHPIDLKYHRCLHYGYQSSGSQWRLNDHSYAINCVMWSNNGEVLKQTALQHQGIAMLPTFIVGDTLQTGELRSVLSAYPPSALSLTALYPRHKHLAVKVRLLVDLLKQRFGGRPYWDLVE